MVLYVFVQKRVSLHEMNLWAKAQAPRGKPQICQEKKFKEPSYHALYKLLFSQDPLQDSANRACHIQGCHAKSVLQRK